MISAKAIQATCDDIVREFAPLQVILFGSYAYGAPTEDSDVDLLVVMDILKSETWQQRCAIKARIPKRFPLDLQVRSAADIAYRFSHNDWFLHEVLEKGDVLYETEGALPPMELAEDTLVPIWQEKGVINPLTLEKVRTAESDWEGVKRLQQPLTPQLYDLVCFHAQQCIEKYLKAWLQEANLPVPRTHDLQELLHLIVPLHPEWRVWRPDFKRFSTHAVDVRYEHYYATRADVEHAVHICTEVRQTIRATLQLQDDA